MHRRAIDQICPENKCSGCSCCVNVCKQNAITMQPDKCGFVRPVVDPKKCIGCELCRKKCPSNDENVENNTLFNKKHSSVQMAYAAYNKDLIVRQSYSSSGGIFSVLAKEVLRKGGVVFGAAFTKDYKKVCHTFIDKEEDLVTIYGSKYVQSELNDSFVKVQTFLKQGKTVLFSGTACQIEGLASFLGNVPDNLFLIDLICMGVPTQKLWAKYLDLFFEKENISCVNFKDKSKGWTRFSVRIVSDSKSITDIGQENPFMRFMFERISIRPSCFNCPYKKSYRLSDITLADCWGYNYMVDNAMFDNKGLSSVFIHSNKGLYLFNSISNRVETQIINWNVAAENNKNLIECVREPHNREKKLLKALKCKNKIRFIFLSGSWKKKIKRLLRNVKRVIKK